VPLPSLSEPIRSPQDPALVPYRRELASGFRMLRFGPDLEPGFREALQTTQFRNLVGCMLVSLAVLVVFAGLDVLRLRFVQEDLWPRYFQQVMVPRWIGIVLLAVGTWVVATRRAGRWLVPLVVAQMVMYAVISFSLGHTLGAMGIPMAHGVGLLIIMVVFYPCGLSFYESLAASLGCWLAALLTGVWLLPPDPMGHHWIDCVVMLFAMGVAAMNGYLREYAMREQYLMRHLLDWDAGHDPLTGLANRRIFGEWGAASLAQAQRTGERVALAIMDVDHFKAYNDQYGHVAGDVALQQLGRLIAQQVRRPLDLAVRLGGEEFAVFSFGEDARSLGARLSQMQEALRKQAIPHVASPTAPWLTVSVGVAQSEAQDNLDSLYRRADLLLYRAKAAGRNQVEVQPDGGSTPGMGHATVQNADGSRPAPSPPSEPNAASMPRQ
jgi:diguanylate cyclase (GGDEF)-like protein